MGDFITDALGWCDDFRAPPGQCGQPLSIRLYAHALLRQGVSIRQLKNLGFDKAVIAEIQSMILDQEFEKSVE